MINRATVFLAFVFVLFVGILIATAYIAKKTDPVILDEKGRPRPVSTL